MSSTVKRLRIFSLLIIASLLLAPMSARTAPVAGYDPSELGYDLYWFGKDGPAPCTGEACLEMTRVLSKMSDEQLVAVLRSDHRWVQDAGQSTATPDDDGYHAVLQSGAPYTVTSLLALPVTQTVGGVVTATATAPSAPDGTLISFATDVGEITPRTIVSDGLALAHLTSSVSGTAHISATARGTGGLVQATTAVTFTVTTLHHVYLPSVLKNAP